MGSGIEQRWGELSSSGEGCLVVGRGIERRGVVEGGGERCRTAGSSLERWRGI